MTATINGVIATRLRLSVPYSGPWFIDADLADDTPLEGAVAAEVLGSRLQGTVDPNASGTFGLQRSVRVVGGKNGWSKLVRARGYGDGVSAELVARDAARDAGEVLGDDLAFRAPQLGDAFARSAGTASKALEVAVGGFAWWVDFDGITRAAPTRAPHTPESGSYEILEFDRRSKVATIAVDRLDAIRVGSVLTERLDEPETVSSFELIVEPNRARVIAWCSRTAPATSEIGDLLQAIVRRTIDQKLWGRYRYRVINMAGDRVNLQSMRPAAGVPDLISIKMTPGIAGAHAVLAKGAEVRVMFDEGDPALPEVVGFGGKEAPGHVPESLTLCGSELQGARQGDMVELPMVGVSVVFDVPPGGTGVPLPMSTNTPYLLSFNPLVPPTLLLAASAYGFVATGSPKVKL